MKSKTNEMVYQVLKGCDNLTVDAKFIAYEHYKCVNSNVMQLQSAKNKTSQ